MKEKKDKVRYLPKNFYHEIGEIFCNQCFFPRPYSSDTGHASYLMPDVVSLPITRHRMKLVRLVRSPYCV